MKYVLTLLVCAGLALVACGGGGGGDEAAIRKTVSDFQNVFGSGDPGKTYDLLSEESKKDCKKSDFVSGIALLKGFLGGIKFTTQVTDVKIDGDEAVATTIVSVDGEAQDPDDVVLVKESGKWHVVLDGGCDLSADGSGSGSSSGSATPGPSPTPVTVKSQRKATAVVSQTSSGVKITVDQIKVADFAEYIAAVDKNTRDDINFASESKGAITIGELHVKIENTTAVKVQLYPRDSVIVIGSEQVDTASFLGDDALDGVYFPGVIKEGTVYFFLKRTAPAAVSSVLVAMDGPFDATTYSRLGPDYQFTVEFR